MDVHIHGNAATWKLTLWLVELLDSVGRW